MALVFNMGFIPLGTGIANIVGVMKMMQSKGMKGNRRPKIME